MSTSKQDLFVRHRGPVTCVAGIPNAELAVTSGYDGAVGIFDFNSKKAELLGYHEHLVNRISVNKSGTKAASSSSDYTIYIWDLKKRRLERVLRGHSDDVEDFVFVSDSVGVSVSRDWRIIVWNLDTGGIMRIIDGHEKDVLSIDYHNRELFTSGDDMTLRAWDLESGEQHKMWGPFDTETDTCAIDRIHNRAALGCDDGHVRVFDIESGKLVGEIEAHSSGIKKVAVSPANGDILSAAYDQKILVWDAQSLENKCSLEHRPALWERSFNWSPDGRRVLAGTFDGTVLVWDAATGKCLDEIGTQDKEPGNACLNDVSANGAGEIALVSDDGFVRLARVSATDAACLAEVAPASGRILMNAVTIDSAYNLVIGGAHDQKLHIFEISDDRLTNEHEVFLGEGPINCVRVAHHPGFEGVSFVACYSGAIVRVTKDGRIDGKFRLHENAVKALRLHPDKPLGVSCSADGILVSWDLDGNLLKRFPGHTAIIDDVDIDPTGKYVASAGRDFTLNVYRIDDGQLLHTVLLGRRSPKGVCFVDENTVVVTNYWGELLKVSLPDEKIYRKQIAHNGISSIARADGDLIAASYDGGAYLVRADDLSTVQTLRFMNQRVEDSAA